MNRSIALAACVITVACGGSRSTPATESTAASLAGLYEFSANTPNQVIHGNVRLTEQGIGVQFETACQPEATRRGLPKDMPSSTSLVRYYCSGAWLTFDRRNPMSAKWYATVQTPRKRETCVRYETQNGRQVCVSRGTETYYVSETRSGGIQVQRVR